MIKSFLIWTTFSVSLIFTDCVVDRQCKIAFVDATFLVAKRKPEKKIQAFGYSNRGLTSAIPVQRSN